MQVIIKTVNKKPDKLKNNKEKVEILQLDAGIGKEIN